MTAGLPDARLVAAWLSKLRGGVANAPEQSQLAASFAATSLGCADVPERAWCEATLTLGLREWQFWPAAAQVRKLLLGWCKDNPEPRPRIAAPSERDAWLEKIERQRAEAAADWSDPSKVRASMVKVMALWCPGCGAEYAPEQVGVLVCTQCGAELRQHDRARQRMLGGFLAGLVRRHAPQNLHLLRPEWIGDPDDAGGRRRAA